jgi:TonB family protein
MITTRLVVLVTLLLLVGCSSPRMATAPEPASELISLSPLPTLTTPTAFGVKLIVLFHVMPDGIPKEVSLLRSSGDTEWDAPAIDSLMQWRFAPLAGDKEKVDRWVRYAVVVQVQEPIIMRLAEMVIPTESKADSLYALLKGGADFDVLGKAALTGGKEGYWKQAEAVNLARFPSHVRDALCPLRSDQVTEPIRIGLNYIIFKRYHQPN